MTKHPIKYTLLIGALFVLTGCFLFVSHSLVVVARILLMAGVITEAVALLMFFKHAWSKGRA